MIARYLFVILMALAASAAVGAISSSYAQPGDALVQGLSGGLLFLGGIILGANLERLARGN